MTERDFVVDMNHSLAFVFKHEYFPQTKGYYKRQVNKVTSAGISTYEQVYAALSDLHTDEKLHVAVLVVLWNIYLSRAHPNEEILDRRRLVISLTHALQSRHWQVREWALQLVICLDLTETAPMLEKLMLTDRSERVRYYARRILTTMGNEKAIELSIEFASQALAHRSDQYRNHESAIITLAEFADRPQVLQILLDTMLDTTEGSDIRGFTARWLAHMATPSAIPVYVRLLADSDVEVRFSAAQGLASMGISIDVSEGLAEIDRVVARDNEVNLGQWSVASAALPALERCWYRKLVEPDAKMWEKRLVLISPQLEYRDYQVAGERVDSTTGLGDYVLVEQSTTLAIDPAILTAQLLEKWPNAKINVRHPQPESLILDWLIEGGEEPVMGGLHRNGYWLFLTGLEAEVQEVAVWLRGIIPNEHLLRLYSLGHWADFGVEITPDFAQRG